MPPCVKLCPCGHADWSLRGGTGPLPGQKEGTLGARGGHSVAPATSDLRPQCPGLTQLLPWGFHLTICPGKYIVLAVCLDNFWEGFEDLDPKPHLTYWIRPISKDKLGLGAARAGPILGSQVGPSLCSFQLSPGVSVSHWGYNFLHWATTPCRKAGHMHSMSPRLAPGQLPWPLAMICAQVPASARIHCSASFLDYIC